MKETIYKQDAIDALMEILDRPNHAEYLYTDEICKALGQLPSAQPYTDTEIQTMQDLEQAQLDKAYQIGVEEGLQSAQKELSGGLYVDGYNDGYRDGMKDAQPKRPNGEWIPEFNGNFTGGAYWFSCSKCNRIVPEVRNGGWDYCPNCGAYMGEQDE